MQHTPSALGKRELFIKGAVDDVLQSYPDPSALRHCLRHEDDEHVLFRVDPEGGPARTGPVHLADGSFCRTHAGFRPNRETEPKAEARSGQVVWTRSNARARPYVVGAHIGDRLRAKIAAPIP